MNQAKSYILLLISFFLFISISSFGQFTFTTKTVNTVDNGEQSVRLLSELTTNAELSIYGGNKKKKVRASGYFHYKQLNNCWYKFKYSTGGLSIFRIYPNATSNYFFMKHKQNIVKTVILSTTGALLLSLPSAA